MLTLAGHSHAEWCAEVLVAGLDQRDAFVFSTTCRFIYVYILIEEGRVILYDALHLYGFLSLLYSMLDEEVYDAVADARR